MKEQEITDLTEPGKKKMLDEEPGVISRELREQLLQSLRKMESLLNGQEERSGAEQEKMAEHKQEQIAVMNSVPDCSREADSVKEPVRYKSLAEKIKCQFVDELGRIRHTPETDYLPYITRTHTQKIHLSDIDYIRYEQDHIIISLTNGCNQRMIGRLSDIYTYLNSDFQHALSSCIVNMANIEKMRDATVFFESGRVFTIGLTNFHKLRHAYNHYLQN